MKQQMMRKFAPAQFANKEIRIARQRMASGCIVKRPKNLARSDFSEMQMRRQTRGVIVIGTIAAFFVIFDGVVFESAQESMRALFARLPMIGKLGIPVNGWQQ